MNISYVSRRGKRIIKREGDIIVDQFPGDERRLVLRRPIGKKLMVNLRSQKLCQQRDDESKWTRIGDIVGVDDAIIEDRCPECGPVTGELDYRGADLKHRDWVFVCGECGAESNPMLENPEPIFPEPPSGDYSDVLQQMQKYADDVNDEIFHGEIDLSSVSWVWNARNGSTAGRAYGGYKIELTPQYYEQHGWNEFLKVVRHEMIHIWESQCGDRSAGHGAQFHQWLVPANTRRHCRHFNRS